MKSGQKEHSGMYKQSAGQWNPFAGCEHECVYCVRSFQRQLKRGWRKTWKPDGKSKGCEDCRDYKPHEHPNRFEQRFPKTKDDEFIFVVATGDICFAERPYVKKIMHRIEQYPDRNFLVQTKNPEKLFSKISSFPDNVSLDVTIETNRDEGYNKVSKAPRPSERFEAYTSFRHPHKFLTIEPVIEFDRKVFLNKIEELNPERVYIGYESQGVFRLMKVPEPKKNVTLDFIRDMDELKIPVYLKNIRKAWNE